MNSSTTTEQEVNPTYRVDAVMFERWLKKYLKDLSEGVTFKPATELGLKSYQYSSSYILTAVRLPDSPKPIPLNNFLQLALLTDRSYTLTFLFGYSSIFVGENLFAGDLFRLDLKPSLSELDVLDVTLHQEHERLVGFYSQFRKNIEWEFPESKLRTGKRKGGHPGRASHARAIERLQAGEDEVTVRADWCIDYGDETGLYPNDTDSGEDDLWRKNVRGKARRRKE